MNQFFVIDTPERRTEAVRAVKSLTRKPMYSVEIKPYRRNRSLAQNRLYWSWVNIIAKDKGYEAEEFHEACKWHFLGGRDIMDPITGEIRQVANSSRKLNTKEFTNYLEKIEAAAEELMGAGARLPHPHEYGLAMGVT